MKKTQRSRVGMLNGLVAFYDENQSKIELIPRLLNTVISLKDHHALLHKSWRLQEKAQEPAHDEKDEIKRSLCATADITNDLLYVWAAVENKSELAWEMNKSFSDLYRLSDHEIGARATDIYNLAIENQQVLTTEFGMQESLLLKLENDIKNWEKYYKLMSDKHSDNKKQTEKIADLISKCLDICHNQLDPMMKMFKHSDPDFYTEYKNKRAITDK